MYYPRACQSKVRMAFLGEGGAPNRRSAEPFRCLLGVLGRLAWPEWSRMRSKRPTGIERRRLPNVTLSVVWRTSVPKAYETPKTAPHLRPASACRALLLGKGLDRKWIVVCIYPFH